MKCYVSCPIAIPQWQLDLVIKRLRDSNNAVLAWNRTTSYGKREKEAIQYCDAFVLILPEFAWQYTIETLPKGCKSELFNAVNYGRNIYIAYVNSNKYLNIYKADMSMYPNHIKAAGGTFSCLGQTPEILTHFVETSSVVKEPVIESINIDITISETYTYDRRLLLLM